MALDVTITRRTIKDNYFQQVQLGGGYATTPSKPPSVTIIEEWRRISNIDTTYPTGEVIVTFLEEFPSVPVMMKLEVFRYSEQMTDKYQRIPVFFDYGDDSAPIKTTGFTIYINSNEPLAGIVIEFGFREYTL